MVAPEILIDITQAMREQKVELEAKKNLEFKQFKDGMKAEIERAAQECYSTLPGNRLAGKVETADTWVTQD